MVTVYDKDGVAHEKQSVDARECVQEMGWTYEKQEAEKPKKTKKAVEQDTEETQAEE